jgi:excisionase family DNA binding protein
MKEEEWLNLSDAAAMLGVHPSTLRNWSNQGLLPARRTLGGHRRYLRKELDLWLQSQRVSEPREIRLVTQNTLRTTRFQISEGRLNQESWYQKLDEEARQQYRQSGRTMLQGLITYINSEEKAISEAEAIGYEYASRGRRYGMNSIEATKAFLFFRNLLVESMLDVFESAAINAATAWNDVYHKITQFTDEILVTILETYEVYQRGSR